MKKSVLLFSLATLATVGTFAGEKIRTVGAVAPETSDVMTTVMANEEAECEMENPNHAVATGRKKASVKNYVNAMYQRPAGVFYGCYTTDDDNDVPTSYATFYAPSFLNTPYRDATFKDMSEGATSLTWEYNVYDRVNRVYHWNQSSGTVLTVHPGFENDTVPVLTATDGTTTSTYTVQGAKLNSSKEVETIYPSRILGRENYQSAYSNTKTKHLWYSPKYFAASVNRDFSKKSGSFYKTGAKDADGGITGRWFGRNFSGADAVAMAFEKPEHPYKLMRVGVRYQGLTLKAGTSATLRMNVYRLDSIPGYDDEKSVSVVPGALIGTAEQVVDENTTASSKNGILAFDLTETDEDFIYNVTPHIDFPILVEIEGYNTDNVEDFTLLYSSDEFDEGFGEHCYLKRMQSDSTYRYLGTNNFWVSSTTGQPVKHYYGATVFIEMDRPYLHYLMANETGAKDFDAAGEDYTTKLYSYAGADEMMVTDVNGEELPEWLSVELADEEVDGEFLNIVDAKITAAALPEGVKGRSCDVQFKIEGAVMQFKVTQGSQAVAGDINGDGEVNSADVSALVNALLEGSKDAVCDLNGDGEVNSADVSALVNIILGKQ